MLLTNQYANRTHQELINLLHRLGLPLHFNQKGNKQFTNYQRVALIILQIRSKKSIREFLSEFGESRWFSWLGFKKIPRKSTLHDWISLFNMKLIRKLNKLMIEKNISLAAVDGTGIDSWQRSRHYEKIIGNPAMPYLKFDAFIDVKRRKIIDFTINSHRRHDVKCAEQMFRRNNLKDMEILADKGYDCEWLHELVRNKKGKFYAPVRKMNRKSLRKNPKGRYRKLCLNLPNFMGQRSIVENVFFVLKHTQINYLRSRKEKMKHRELGWNVVVYNLKRKVREFNGFESQSVIFLVIWFWSIPDNAYDTLNQIFYTIHG
jgi:hypothetical protein